MVGPQIAVPDHLASLCACICKCAEVFSWTVIFILEFEDSHSITEADGEVFVVAVADSTQLSDEAERSDALSDQLDEEAQPGSGCGELPSGLYGLALYNVQDIIVVLGEPLLCYVVSLYKKQLCWLDKCRQLLLGNVVSKLVFYYLSAVCCICV